MDVARVSLILSKARKTELDRLRKAPMDELIRATVLREVDAAFRNGEQAVLAAYEDERCDIESRVLSI